MLSRVQQIDHDTDTGANDQQEEQPAVAVKIYQYGKVIGCLVAGFICQLNIVFAALRQHIFSADLLTVMVNVDNGCFICFRNIHRAPGSTVYDAL